MKLLLEAVYVKFLSEKETHKVRTTLLQRNFNVQTTSF